MALKPSVVAKHERALKWDLHQKKKIAKELMTAMVLDELAPMVEAQITRAKEGDTKAFDSLIDRTLGPAKSNVDVNVDVKFSLSSLAQQWEETKKNIVPVESHEQ